MDVSLFGLRGGLRVFSIALLAATLISCGNRYDLSTERGRQSRIDDANSHLSRGECAAADEAIDPLYESVYVNDEVRIVKASALACYANFTFLTFAAGLSNAQNFFQVFASSLTNVPGDGAVERLYSAVDVLTQNGSVMNGYQRGTSLNTFMVFLQFAVIGAIERTYGSPSPTGAQGANLIYDVNANPAGEMTNVDACALGAAFSHISDSSANSDLNDAASKSAVSSFDAICQGMGLTSCAQINRVRTACTGAPADPNSVTAQQVVAGVNAGW